MKRIMIPTCSGSDWQRLLAKPILHWKKGASAMTAAAAWEAAGGVLPIEVQTLLDLSGNETLVHQRLLLAIPEWEVALEGGTTTSNTDVLAICRNESGLCIIAVEAKVLEDFGPLLGEKRKEASTGQHTRLDYLHSLLKATRFDDSIRYQLLHRTASALLTAREFHARGGVMLVHAFGTPPDRRADFEAFAMALKADAIASGVYRVRSFENPELYLAWCTGDPRFLQVSLPSAV